MTYCTQAEIEKYLNITFSSNPDPTLALWITAASAKIDQFCGRDFDLHENQTEYYDGKGMWGAQDWQRHNSLRLRNWPVVAVDSVTDSDNALVEGTSYEVYEEEALIRLTPDSRYFTKERKGIVVVYDYGYSAIPEVIKDACRWLVAESLTKQIKFSEAGVAKSISLEGESISYPDIVDFPDWLKQSLQPYVKVMLGGS